MLKDKECEAFLAVLLIFASPEGVTFSGVGFAITNGEKHTSKITDSVNVLLHHFRKDVGCGFTWAIDSIALIGHPLHHQLVQGNSS